MNPQVTIAIEAYAPKQVFVLGAVKKPGPAGFLPEVNYMDIVEVIARAGGFTGIAKSKAVRVTRSEKNRGEKTYTVDVYQFMTGETGGASAEKDSGIFKIYPT